MSVLGQLFRLIKDTDLNALKNEVLENVLPRFRTIPFMDDEELLAGLIQMLERGQDPRFPIKRTKSGKLIYDGKNTELIGRIILRARPELGLILQYDDTTDDEDASALDRAYDGRIARGSLSKSDRAFQAVEAYLRQNENKQAIKAAGGRAKSQAQLAAERGVSPTYVEDLLRVRKKSAKLYALVGARKIKVKSAAAIADDEDEDMCTALLGRLEEMPHHTDDEVRNLLREYRAEAEQKKLPRASKHSGLSDPKGTATSGTAAPMSGPHVEVEPSAALGERSSIGTHVATEADGTPPGDRADSGPKQHNEQRSASPPATREPAIVGEGVGGIFTDILAALIHLQRLLRSNRATPGLIEALENSLAAASESLQ